MPRGKKRVSRKAEGAKAPEALLSGGEAIALHRFLDQYLRTTSPEKGGDGSRPASINTPNKIAGPLPPPNPPPYMPRLKNIVNGLRELNSSQRAFRNYLDPQPTEATTAGNQSDPCGVEETISAIEGELNIAHNLFAEFQRRF